MTTVAVLVVIALLAAAIVVRRERRKAHARAVHPSAYPAHIEAAIDEALQLGRPTVGDEAEAWLRGREGPR